MLEVFAAILTHANEYVVFEEGLGELEVLLLGGGRLLLVLGLMVEATSVLWLWLNLHRHVHWSILRERRVPACLTLATRTVEVFTSARLRILGLLFGGNLFCRLLRMVRNSVILLERTSTRTV